MIVIGELINSTRDEVLIAIEDRDADTIKNLALRQAEAGVDYIDVNAGAFVDDEFEHLAWTIETVRSVTDLPLALDSADPEVIEKALEISGPAMINSITAETEKLERIIPLAKKYHAKLIALCLDDNGMPTTAEDRIRIADKFAQAFEEAQIPLEDVFLDPLVKPVSVNEQFGNEVLATLDEINRRYPGFHTTCGLSNVSYGLPKRRILNQAFFILCIGRGMDAVIIDPLDKKIVSLMYAAEAVAGRDPKMVTYLKKVREGIISE
jgi:cobalamin-dependent methionine synthase I